MRAIDRLRRSQRGTDSPLLPVLRPAGWQMAIECAHRRLIWGRSSLDSPMIAVGRDRGTGLDLVKTAALDQLGMSLAELVDYAVGNLVLRPGDWEVIHTDEGTGRPMLLGFEGDGIFAASRVVDAEFLERAHQRIGSKVLLVGIPHNRAIFATDGSAVSDRSVHAAFAEWNERHHARAEGVDAVSPRTYVVRAGKVFAVYEAAADE